ncbi:hypothetical protein D3C76_1673300 [compost metagenome]
MRVLVVTEALQNQKKFGAQHTGRLRLAKQLATDQRPATQVNGQRLAHQTLGRRQRTRCAPVSFSHGQQLRAIEQPGLQQIDPLQPRIHLQTIEAV